MMIGWVDVQSVVQIGSGGTSGVITGDSETLVLDNVECEVAGGKGGAADRGSVSYNGSIEKYGV
jgi:hypothetical protein